jgi:Tol biopolymer transport system component
VAQFSVSNSGSLAYIPGPASIKLLPQFNLAQLDASGRTDLLNPPVATYESPRVSPDGKQIAVTIVEDKETNIWIYDLTDTSAMRRLTFGGRERFPIWSSDGRYVAFQSERDGDIGIFWQRADFSGTAERLTKPDPGTAHVPESWSPRGDVFTYSILSYGGRQGAGPFSLASFSIRDKQSRPIAGVRSTLPLASTFSRDGHWLAYNVSDSPVGGPAQATVFVEPFPPTAAKYQISASRHGFHPIWLPDGKRLSYSTGIDSLGPLWVTAELTMQPRFTIGSAIKVPNGGLIDSVPFAYVNGPFGFVTERNYDLTPDGKRVGIMRADPFVPARSGPIHVVQNWFEELKQRVPTK